MVNQYLTEKQREHWNEEGYLVLKQVLSPEEIRMLLNAVDPVIEDYVQEELGADAPRAFTIIRAIERTEALDILTDHPKTFGTILSLMGPYLQIMGTQIYVRYPSDTALIGFHTDAGPSLQQIHPHPQSLPLQFKVQFFLTDLSQPDSGNFILVPSSHRKPFPSKAPEKGFVPEGAIQVLAEAGDAVIFPWAQWHAVGPNKTDWIRKSVTFRYGQMWSRPYDYETLPPHVLERMTPRRQRLFGYMGENYHPTDYFKPHDQLEIILGDEWKLEA